MAPSTPKRQRGPTMTSHEDGSKVTMQTRVAVRDKTPHRFQVVPLREMLKHPVQSLSSMEPTKSPRLGFGVKSPQRGPSGRRGNVVDESIGKKSKDKAKTHSLRRPALLDRNANTEPDLFSPTHNKTSSLEMDARSDENESPQQSPTLASSRGFSQSLNQYTFRLKPWKSYTHLQATPTRKRHSEKSLEELTGRNRGYLRTNSAQSDWDFTPRDVDTGHCDFDQYSPSPSTTLVNSAAQLNVSEGSKKRHAIYSHTGIPPAHEYEYEGGDSLGFDDVFSAPKVTRRNTLRPSTPDAAPAQATGTPPLRLARKLATRHWAGPAAGEMCYPETVLELLRDLDDAIEGWNHSFSGVVPR